MVVTCRNNPPTLDRIPRLTSANRIVKPRHFNTSQCHSMPTYAYICLHMPTSNHTNPHNPTNNHTNTHDHTCPFNLIQFLSCAGNCWYVLLCIGNCWYVLFCIGNYWYVLICTDCGLLWHIVTIWDCHSKIIQNHKSFDIMGI